MDPLSSAPLWNLPMPSDLPALADEDFITLLQKQFGVNNGFTGIDDDKEAVPQSANINPQNLSRLPIPRPVESPPSDDSSPSPNEASTSRSRRESGVFDLDGPSRQSEEAADEDPSLKRKAVEEDLDSEPNHKSQHTSGSKKNSSSRRKSTGNPSADESRLMKRKEQNRAAQRAFRERKEKHVKDLEDQVAALEEKNTAALQENESLREVVTRLQSENVRLRQSSFTFSVPSASSSTSSSITSKAESSRAAPVQTDVQQEQPMNLFGSPPSTTTSSTASTHDSPQSLFANDTNDGQMSFLGPNLMMLNPAQQQQQQQQTATADAMNLDFGFGPVSSHTPYTTIASNPLFMSFREPDVFDPLAHQGQSQGVNHNGQPFDFSQQLFPGWPDVTMNGSMQAFDLTNSLDELFGGSGSFGGTPGIDFPMNGASKASPSASLSPVSHQHSNGSTSGSSSSSSSESSPLVGMHDKKMKCTKADLANAVAQDSGSMFVTRDSTAQSEDSTPSPPAPGACDEEECNEFPPCKGLQLPKTQKSEKNVELMSAWRTIRHDPKFQDVDINQLCTEFAAKARCDGCHVVIEPSGMQEILDTVTKQKKTKRQSELFSASASAGLLAK